MTQSAEAWFVRLPDGRVVRAKSADSVRHHIERGRIPPDVDIGTPGWYAPERGRFVVAGHVHGRTPAHWILELGAGVQPTRWSTIARSSAGRGRCSRVSR